MDWITTSKNYMRYNFITKRGLLMVLFIGFLNVFLNVFFIGLNYFARLWRESEGAITVSEIDIVRTRVHDGGFLIYLWMIAIIMDTAFLYKNQLFQRFIINGQTRMEWGHFIMCNILVISFIVAVLQTVFVNALGLYFYDAILVNISFTAKLWAALLLTGLFAVLLTSLIPTFITPLILFGWIIVEQVLNNNMLKQVLHNIPEFLPIKLLNSWMWEAAPSLTKSIVLGAYFLLMLFFLYLTVNKKPYVQS